MRPKRLFPVQRVCFLKMQPDELRAVLGEDNWERLVNDPDFCPDLVEALQNLRLQDFFPESEAEAEAVEAVEAEAAEAEDAEAEAAEAENAEAEAAEAEDAEAEAEASEAGSDSDVKPDTDSDASADDGYVFEAGSVSKAVSVSEPDTDSEAGAESEAEHAGPSRPPPSEPSSDSEPSTPPRADHLPKLTPAEMGSNEKLGKRTTISKGGFSSTHKSISSAIRTIQEREPEFANEPIANMQVKVSKAKKKRERFKLFGYNWRLHRAVHSMSTTVSESQGHLVRVVWDNGPPENFTDYSSVQDAVASSDGLFDYFRQHPEIIRQEDNRKLLVHFCGRHPGRYAQAELEAMSNELNFVENETVVRRLTVALRDKLRDNGYNVVFFGIRVFQIQSV